MADVKVTRDCYVPKENVKLYASYEPSGSGCPSKKKKDLSLIIPMAERSRL